MEFVEHFYPLNYYLIAKYKKKKVTESIELKFKHNCFVFWKPKHRIDLHIIDFVLSYFGQISIVRIGAKRKQKWGRKLNVNESQESCSTTNWNVIELSWIAQFLWPTKSEIFSFRLRLVLDPTIYKLATNISIGIFKAEVKRKKIIWNFS